MPEPILVDTHNDPPTPEGIDNIIQTYAKKSPIGAFVVFETPDDPHSPVMKPRYEGLLRHAEDQLPYIRFLNSHDIDKSILEKYLVYSTPTLLWVGPDGNTVMRLVGTVNERKLRQEFDERIDLVLQD